MVAHLQGEVLVNYCQMAASHCIPLHPIRPPILRSEPCPWGPVATLISVHLPSVEPPGDPVMIERTARISVEHVTLLSGSRQDADV